MGRTVEERDWGQIIANNTRDIEKINQSLDEQLKREREIVENLKNTVQKIGLVRFDAFEDLGGQLSFAIALLNEYDNGLIISSIYGREESRNYAKPVEKGKSPYTLSQEEQKAIVEAGAASLNLEVADGGEITNS